MDKLLEQRKRIDEIDNQIMDLLDERYDISIEIGNIKEESKTPVLDSGRELEVLKKTAKLRHSLAIKNVYTSIMEESKKLQRK